MTNHPGKQRPEECCRPSATQSMNLWQVLFLLTLGRCSGTSDVSQTLFDAYPFDLMIKIPGVNLSKYVLETDEVPFVAKKEITAGGLRLRGIPLGDPDDLILVKWESPEGETKPVAIEFSFRKLDVTDQGCKLYPAAVIEIGEYSFYESNRERLFDAIDTLSKRIEYPMKRMKVQPPLNPNENWRLGLMASENCPGENSTQIWTAINRIVEKIHGDDIGEIDGVSPKVRVTKEFSEIFRNLPRRLGPNEGIDRGIAFPSTPTNGTIEGRSNEVVMTLAASSASSSTLSAPIVEPIETSTEVRTTTSTEVPVATTTEISTTTSTEVPTTTTTEVPTTTTTEVPTTTTTEVPTTTSTEVPTTTSTEVPTTTSTEVPLTTSTEVPPTTSTKAPFARTTETPPIMPTASVATSTTSGIQFPIVTEIALAGEEDVETARRLDEENPETFIEQNSGASVAMPLFAIIVLLAITSAVAVFTVARARNVHRKTFVIGNASPDEINDIVVLGSDDVFN